MLNNETVLRLYEEERNLARFHEGQRAVASNMVAVISALLIGVITFDKKISPTDLVPALMIIGVGFYGLIFVLKLTERRKLHFNRGYELLKHLDSDFSGMTAREIMLEADKYTKKSHPILYCVPLVAVWATYQILVAIIGVALAIVSQI